MHSSQPAYASLTRFSCVVLSYSLLLSLWSPLSQGAALASGSARTADAATPANAAQKRGAHRDGELIVRFRPHVSEQEIEEIMASRGARRGRRLRGASRTDKLTLPAGHDPETLAAELRTNPAVEFAEPNYLIKRNEIVPDDPRFGEQWVLKNTGGTSGQAGSDVGATHAWEVTTGAASTVIAVIDSGIDFTHPDLRGNQWANSKEAENGQDDDGNDLVDDIHGWDWITNSNVIRDAQGHGTIIAGIIAAQGNNATGVSGVMWRASVMSLRVLDETGTGDVADAVEAIDYAVAHGARVINCSWGMDAASESLKDAIRRATRRGVLVVCSAGNDGRNIDGTPYYPASFELGNLIAVASTDNSDQLTTWSNWGAMRTHVGAPGENILSSKMGGGYKMVSGSSASAPVVAGVAGLVKSLRPYLSAKLIREMILAGVRPVETLTGKVSSGGVVNAAGALGALNTLPPDEGLKEGDERGDNNNGDNPNGGNGGNGNGNGGHRPEPPIERTKGAPGLNLPNLDEVRRLRPATPGAPAPIRSNLAPNCDPNDPDCAQCYGCEPTPAPPPPSSSPVGWLDGIGGNGSARGWAFDPDANAQPIEVHSIPARATFVKTDTTTQGNWKGMYGAEGYALVGDVTSYPAYAQVSVTGAATHTWATSTPDVRALQKSAQGSADRIAATWYNSTNYTIDLNLTDGQTHQVAIYSVDWDYNMRAQKVEVLDAATGALLDSRNMSAYTNGQYVVWNLSGHVKMKVSYTGPAGLNAVTGGLFFDPSPAGRAASATFLRSDTTTQGNWKGVYGVDGYQVMGDGTSYPAYAQVNPRGHLPFTWVASTAEVRAPLKSAPGTDRIAACWYSNTSLDMDLNLTDGQQHQVALYVLDWDGNNGRAQRIDIFDAATGSLLDSRSVSAFSGGHYVVWNLSGHVIIKATSTGIHNAVISGLFFAPSNSATPADPTGNNFSVARLDPSNRTGQAGTDLFSGNYNWGVSLAILRGRAGVDLALSLSYNSLVWTKDQAAIKYDADRGTPSAGFRLGFPVIEKRFYNPATNRNAYLMITPSGQRVELRQVSSSGVYEAADSSYLQLIDNGTLTVRTTDGTQLSYVWSGNVYRCTQIKDRNGNYMTATYYGHGGIQTITDTLGRVVNFNYDGYNRPISITQTWNGSTHTWATFGYGDIFIQPDFLGLAVYGPQNQTISVLTQVGLDDGTRYNFEYAPAGQVSVIRHYAAEGHQLSYTAYDFDANGTDCPRVMGRRDYAEDWNNGVEALTTYADEGGGGRAVTMPDRSTVYKEFFGTAGWQRGLSTRTEVLSKGLQKWTTTEWTQDDPGLAYQQNPRPFDSSIYDAAGNRRRTAITYTNYGLPSDIREYAADGQNVLRRTHVDYKFDAVYLERRIIGLPGARFLYEGESTLVAKSEFHYDWGGEYFSAQSPSVQHDGVSYGSAYLTGRGNLTAVRRFDKNASDDPQQAVWQQISGYNAAGSPVFTRDAAGHTTQLSYADVYSDRNSSRNTLAYPTKVTDADGFSSTAEYNYDLGVTTRTEGPPAAGHTQGTIASTVYDAAGRVERVRNETSGAYTRYVYGADSKYVQSFSLIQAGVESYSIQVFDGAGRVRATGGSHLGSAGGYGGQFIKYDVMGRAVEQTNPAEITAGWLPAGDDAAGWVWNKQAYDWKGRPTVTTNVDGTTREASYGGCGCAGGEVVTLRDEIGRRRRLTADVLGRGVKSEDLNADGSIYRTATTSYNALDQVTRSLVQAGTSGTGQETVLTYDGHARLLTQKAPVQTTATRYAYHADDTVQSVTDARGVRTLFAYNSRHLITKLTYDRAGNNSVLISGGGSTVVEAVPEVTFGYDAAGNRTSLATQNGEGGSVTYNYDRLSRIASEVRQLPGLTGVYTLSYQYTLTGALEQVNSSLGTSVSYQFDQAGQLNGVTGTGFGTVTQPVTQLASNLRYRAWGGLKGLTYGNNLTLSMSYTARLQLEHFEIGGRNSQYGSPVVAKSDYQYQADGRLLQARDLLDERFHRAYAYDHVGELKEAYTGGEASNFVNGTTTGQTTGPYRQTYTRDVWGHLTRRDSRMWSQTDTSAMNYAADNRRTEAGWSYDAAGNVARDPDLTYTYDAAGRTRTVVQGGHSTTQTYDGEGQVVRRDKTEESGTMETTFYLRSSVLGGRVVAELGAQGEAVKQHVYAGGAVLATRDAEGGVEWQHANPVTGSRAVSYASTAFAREAEMEPLGVDVGFHNPFVEVSTTPVGADDRPTLLGGSGIPSGRCQVDGMNVECEDAQHLMASGAALVRPEQTLAAAYRGGEFLGYVHWEQLAAQAGVGVGGQLGVSGSSEHAGWLWGANSGSMSYMGGGLNIGGTFISNGEFFGPARFDNIPNPNYDGPRGGPPRYTEIASLGGGLPAPQKTRDGFPCPPTINKITARNPALIDKFSDLLARGQQAYREMGGWIFMDKKGNTSFVEKTFASSQDNRFQIDLSSPPSISGQRVVATVHTHPSDAGPSVGRNGDIGINTHDYKVPGIVLRNHHMMFGSQQSPNTSERMDIFGPKSGFWLTGQPKGC
jgi:YD repeat-containing protein